MGKITKHKSDLEALKKKDPEFYKFLEENDSQMLEFGLDDGDDDDEEGDEEAEDENENDDTNDEEDFEVADLDDVDEDEPDETNYPLRKAKIPKSAPRESTGLIDITSDMLESTLVKCQSGSFAAIKKLVTFFTAACSPASNNQDVDSDDDMDLSDSQSSKSLYTVSSPDVYNDIMTKSLDILHELFHKLFNDNSSSKEASTYNYSLMEKHPKWKKYQSILISFFKAYMSVLSGIHTSNTSTEVGVYLLTALKDYIIYLTCLPRLSKSLLKILLLIWSQGPNLAEDSQNVRGNSLLRIRQLSTTLPGTMTEECFRSIYLIYAKNCKSYSEFYAPKVTFMIESIVQLYKTNISHAYQQAFLYIRQMALHLRSVILKKSKEQSKQLSSWQYLNCIRLWTKILCHMPKKEELGNLFFPLSQIIIGMITTTQSAYYLPLKFHSIECLHQLAAYGQYFIPTAPKLYDILDLSDFHSKSTPSTDTSPSLDYIVKFPTNSITTQVVKDLIIQKVIILIQQDADIYKYNVGYPEYVYITIRKLRAFAKNTKVTKWRDMCRALVSQLEDHSIWVKTSRNALHKSPMEITEFEPLLPFGTLPAAGRLNKSMNHNQVKLSQRRKVNESSANTQIAINNKHINASKNTKSPTTTASTNGNSSNINKRKYDEHVDDSDDDDDDDDISIDMNDDEEEEEKESTSKSSKKHKTTNNTSTKVISKSKVTHKKDDKNHTTKIKSGKGNRNKHSSLEALQHKNGEDDIVEEFSWNDDD